MSLIDIIIRREEGRQYKAYVDPRTKAEPITIGEGHTEPGLRLGTTWTDAQIDKAKADDIAEATVACQAHFNPWFDRLDEVRRAVLVSMAYQMGIGRLLGFVKFLGAMRDQRWHQAAGEMLDSKWAKLDSPKRAQRAARAVETGLTEWA